MSHRALQILSVWSKLTVITDHRTLFSIMKEHYSKKSSNKRLIRWVDTFLPFNFKNELLPGTRTGLVNYSSGKFIKMRLTAPNMMNSSLLLSSVWWIAPFYLKTSFWANAPQLDKYRHSLNPTELFTISITPWKDDFIRAAAKRSANEDSINPAKIKYNKQNSWTHLFHQFHYYKQVRQKNLKIGANR